MRTSILVRASLVTAWLVTSGCASTSAALRELPQAELATEDQVREWTQIASPFTVILMLSQIEGELEGELETENECPARVEFGPISHWHGGCDDWVGSRHLKRARSQLVLRLDDFGRRRPAPGCPGVEVGKTSTGKVRVSEQGGDTQLQMELLIEAWEVGPECASIRTRLVIDYEAHTTGSLLREDPFGDHWNGSGTIGTPEGRIEVVTRDYQFDAEICKHEPSAGTTELRSAGHVVVVSFDGASDCDAEGTARWTRDGEPMGELSGVGCSVASGRSPGGIPIAVLLGLLGWLGRYSSGRRRRCLASFADRKPGTPCSRIAIHCRRWP